MLFRSLEIGSPQSAPRHYVREQPLGVPFEVTLSRWPHNDGKLWLADFVPEDLEGKRRLRIRIALEEKWPKLQRAAHEGGTTILVLESSDIALSNTHSVASAFLQELDRRQGENPDQVWLVETETEPWYVLKLKEGDQIFRANHYLGRMTIPEKVRSQLLTKWSLRFRDRKWMNFSLWEAKELRNHGGDFDQALAWMWEAWQLAGKQDRTWATATVDSANTELHREVSDAFRRLRLP